VNALFVGERLPTSGNVQNRKPLGLGFLLLENVSDQVRDIVNVDELNLVLQVLAAIRQHGRQSGTALAHPFCSCAAPTSNSPECLNEVVAQASAGENVRAKKITTATTQPGRALLHDAISFHLVHAVNIGVRSKRSFLVCGRGEIRAVGGNTAYENEL